MGKFDANNVPRYLTGCGAMALSLLFLISHRADFPVVAASIFFFLACAVDTHRAKIPNLLNLLMVVAGLMYHTVSGGGTGLLFSVSGLALGLGLLLLPYLMGGMGAGDVKAFAALGAMIGPRPLLHVFVYMAFFGGAMAIAHYLFNTNLRQKTLEWYQCVKASVLAGDPSQLKPDKTEPLRFPYAAAIAFGYYTYLTWGGVL